MNDLNLIAYLIYLPVTVYITVWVGWVCYKNGEEFIKRMMTDQRMVRPVNRILLIGYYLINIGYCGLMLAQWKKVNDVVELIETTGFRIGVIVMILAFMHYLNIMVITIWCMYQRKQNKLYNQT